MATAAAHTAQTWRFGVFEVDAQAGELRRAGIPIKLRDQCFRILVILLEHETQIVTREDLRRALWPAGTFVDFDHSLNAAVMKLREALGDTAEKPLYIETIPKRGYRFIAPVAPEVEISAASTFEQPPQTLRRIRYSWFAAGAAGGVIAFAAGIWYLLRPLPAPRITDYVQITNNGINKDIVGTDGNRLFLNVLQPPSIGQLAASGGTIVPISVDLPPEETKDGGGLVDVSPDGSRLLVLGAWNEADRNSNIWMISSEGHAARLVAKAASATWSPDGRSIAFLSVNGDISVSSADGGEARQIFKGAGQFGIHPGHIRWSPDGTKFRLSSGPNTIDAIWEVSADGSNAHKLFPEWDASMPHCCGRWTPDGQFYVFLAGKTLTETYWYMSRTAQIWVLDERRGGMRQPSARPVQLTPGPIRWGEPVPSRDSGRIFARGVTMRGELVRFDASVGLWRPFLGGISAESIEFSPDGKYVAYVSYPERILWRANRDGSGKIQLTERPLTPVLPQWSPDGSKVLFVDLPNVGASKLSFVPAQGGTPVRVTAEGEEAEEDGSWSPDGRKIAFCSNPWRLGHTERRVEIKVLDLSTHVATTLTSDRQLFSPRWSPDGRYILARPIDKQSFQLFDLATQRWSTLPAGANSEWPVWSHDSRFVYFHRMGTGAHDGIYRISLAGAQPELVTEMTGMRETGMFGGWFGLDRDDAPLILRDVGSDELYALTLER